MNKAIGGYAELELNLDKHYYPNAIRVNSGRNAMEYLLRVQPANKVILPEFFCPVMLEPLTRLGIDYEFYKLDSQLRFPLKRTWKDGEVLIYINYFGVRNEVVKQLVTLGMRLMVDNSQAFFAPYIPGTEMFNSPRKFFGVPDGAYLYSTLKEYPINLEQDESWQRCEHLLRRWDQGAEAGYESYKRNEAALVNHPLLAMSPLTEALLQQINYETIKAKRTHNFKVLHEALAERNLLKFEIQTIDGPMAYPFWIQEGSRFRKKLIADRIFVPTYWPDIESFSSESSQVREWQTNLLALPIDQRYDTDDMRKILEILDR